MTLINKRVFLILLSMWLSYILLRVSLYISPNSNFDVGPYNIHHLFTGILLLVIFSFLLISSTRTGFADNFYCLGFGAGLGLTLDEWVYLIATDGSDSAYLTPVSLWGSIILLSITTIYAIIIIVVKKSK